MAEEFDRDAAAHRHEDLMREIQRMRDGINDDVINYYWSNPQTTEAEREKRDGIRRHLRIASERIDTILDNWQ